jgi:hypothetical protein
MQSQYPLKAVMLLEKGKDSLTRQAVRLCEKPSDIVLIFDIIG